MAHRRRQLLLKEKRHQRGMLPEPGANRRGRTAPCGAQGGGSSLPRPPREGAVTLLHTRAPGELLKYQCLTLQHLLHQAGFSREPTRCGRETYCKELVMEVGRPKTCRAGTQEEMQLKPQSNL